MSAYGPFELAPLEAVIVPERSGPGSAPTLDAVREQAFEEGFAAGVAQAQTPPPPRPTIASSDADT